MKAAKLAIVSFCRVKKTKSVHLQIDNFTALSHLVKMGGTKSAELNKISKEIWEYLILNEITLTAEYLPSSQNIQADWESRHTKDSSEWKLCPQTFAGTTQTMGKLSVDLFCVTPVTSTSTVHVMETGPLLHLHGSGCPATKMDTYVPLCFPSFL